MTPPTLTALSLTSNAAIGLATGDPATVAALDALHRGSGVDLLVLGADTVDAERADAAPRVSAHDPVTIAVARHALFPRWGFLAVAAPTRDHPYNLARRILSVHHLTGGRVGLALADDDAGLPLDDGALPWVPGLAPQASVTADAAAAIRELWNSWPAGSIVGDRVSGQYAELGGIRRIEARGVYRIDGPLGTPASALGEPVLARWGAPEAATAWAELVVHGALLTASGAPIGRLLAAATIAELPAAGVAHGTATHAGATVTGLRGILGLSPRALDLSDRPALFPATDPSPGVAGVRS